MTYPPILKYRDACPAMRPTLFFLKSLWSDIPTTLDLSPVRFAISMGLAPPGPSAHFTMRRFEMIFRRLLPPVMRRS